MGGPSFLAWLPESALRAEPNVNACDSFVFYEREDLDLLIFDYCLSPPTVHWRGRAYCSKCWEAILSEDASVARAQKRLKR